MLIVSLDPYILTARSPGKLKICGARRVLHSYSFEGKIMRDNVAISRVMMGKQSWLLSIAYRTICNGFPGSRLAVAYMAWYKFRFVTVPLP